MRAKYDRAHLEVWVGVDKRIYVRTNMLVEPFNVRSFGSIKEFFESEWMVEPHELATAFYNHCSMPAIDPDLNERERLDYREILKKRKKSEPPSRRHSGITGRKR